MTLDDDERYQVKVDLGGDNLVAFTAYPGQQVSSGPRYMYYKVLYLYEPRDLDIYVSEAGASFGASDDYLGTLGLGDWDVRVISYAPLNDVRQFIYNPMRCNMFEFFDDIWDGHPSRITHVHGG